MTRLVIVESPTKARTIRGFLPKDYRVEACMGHVRDLPESASEIPAAYKGKDWARLGVNVQANFEPLYVVSARKKKVVKELKDALKEADELILATDEDREGESIGWHLTQVLNPKVPTSRMVFHEITREAIQDALKHPRQIDEQLVRAQETRRILDRLVGYTISPLLWKKIAPGLSAGRVQSVAVRMLVTREAQRQEFHPGVYWDLKALLATSNAPKSPFEATLQSLGGVRVATGKDFDDATGKIAAGKKALRLDEIQQTLIPVLISDSSQRTPDNKRVLLLNESDAGTLRDRLLKAVWQVTDLTERSQTRKPAPPFTTSTLQQEANRKLRLPSSQTMKIAQKLYEQGHITYMRTDSVHLSSEAITAARKAIGARYGAEYLSPSPRHYTTQSKGAQEAHEAIRPAGTQMRTADEIGLSGTEGALYDMIWKRTIASQMADARITLITATISAADALFQASGNRIDFPGYFRAYVEGSDDPEASLDDREVKLPRLAKGDALACKELAPLKHETQPPTRFTEATLVQTLEREGIGRPSTYAAIITTIQDRGYVAKTNNQLVPTFKAFAVNSLLEGHFPDLVDTQFTARMEQTLDDIAEGKAEWLPYLKTFYQGEKGLEAQVNEKAKSIDPREINAMTLDEIKTRVRIGRYGPYLEQQGEGEPLRVSLPPDMAPADLNPDRVLELLQHKEAGPHQVGDHPVTGEPIYLLNGPYGLYVQLGEAGSGDKPKRASLLKGMNPETLTVETAVALLSLPRQLGVHPETQKEIYAGVGRFGPFVRYGTEYRSLTAQDDVLKIDLTRALELLNQPKGARRTRKPVAPLRTIGEHPKDGEAVVLMDGPYGPYIRHGKTNVKLPKEVKPEAVTLPQALALLADKAGQAPKTTVKTGKTGKSGGAGKTGKKGNPSTPEKPKRATKKKN